MTEETAVLLIVIAWIIICAGVVLKCWRVLREERE